MLQSTTKVACRAYACVYMYVYHVCMYVYMYVGRKGKMIPFRMCGGIGGDDGDGDGV